MKAISPNVSTLAEHDQIVEMAALDARLFGVHQALTVEELETMQRYGSLLAVRDALGAMVAEAQVIFEAIPTATEPLIKVLPLDDGYFEGFAVDETYRGKGFGLDLVHATSEAMQAQQKQGAWATVRVENAASIRNLTKAGYMVVGYAKAYYPDSPRLVMWKDLFGSADGFEPTVSVDVVPGDSLDMAAHTHVESLLTQGLVGVDVQRSGQKTSLLFAPLAQAPFATQSRVMQKQSFLHQYGIVT